MNYNAGGDEFEERFVAFATRRRIGKGLYSSACGLCGCQMKVDGATLANELRGMMTVCKSCVPSTPRSYGGSPQDSHDNEYHGGRFENGEW